MLVVQRNSMAFLLVQVEDLLLSFVKRTSTFMIELHVLDPVFVRQLTVAFVLVFLGVGIHKRCPFL